MMAAIIVDGKPVCLKHDFEGMTLEYFWDFITNEFIPAYKNELSADEIAQVEKDIKNKQSRIYIISDGGLKHTLIYVNPFIIFSKHIADYEFDGL